MMACWKQNDFNDKACAEEIQTFYDCVAKAEVMKISFVFLKSNSREGGETFSRFLCANIIVFCEQFDLCFEKFSDVHQVHSPFCLYLEFQ